MVSCKLLFFLYIFFCQNTSDRELLFTNAEFDISVPDSAVAEGSCQTWPYTKKLKKRHCDEVEVPMKMCIGYCSSVVYTKRNGHGLVSKCNVCTPEKFEKINLHVTCKKGRKKRTLTRKIISKCACQDIQWPQGNATEQLIEEGIWEDS